MRNKFSKLALAAGFLLALAFTFSCGKHGIDDDNEVLVSSSSSVKTGNQSSSSEIAVTPSSSGKSSSSGGVSSSRGSSSSVNISVGDTSGTFKDIRDGQTYKWVKIDTQIWMAQNLNYAEKWVGPTRGNRCYENVDANCEKYGRLYEWDDAIRVCPDGWHLPTQSEWNTMISAVGSDAGKKLKAKRSEWKDGAGTDIYGFEALPGGGLYDILSTGTNEFDHLNMEGEWWTSTEKPDDYRFAYTKNMDTGNNVDNDHWQKTSHFSVRCVKGYSSSSSIAYGEVTDKRDSQKYITVKIGTLTWMAQNLNYAGTSPQKGLCYNNKDANCKTYGRLYNWATAMNIPIDNNYDKFEATPGPHQGICPDGWHLPTQSEWNTLISTVGSAAGKKLKARRSEWGDNYGINIYGFEALPGGGLYDILSTGTNEFDHLNTEGEWWTSTEKPNDHRFAYTYNIDTGNNVDNDHWQKTSHFSVRCVED